MNTAIAKAVSPYNWNDEATLEKMSHLFSEGQKVRHLASGRRGKVTAFASGNRIHVELDSGHNVLVSPDEIEPADFPSAPNRAGLNADLLEAGAKIAKARIEKHIDVGFSDPFAILETHDEEVLRKYAEFTRDNIMRKSASGFEVGQRVRQKASGRAGKVTGLGSNLVSILYDDGSEGSSVAAHIEAADRLVKLADLSKDEQDIVRGWSATILAGKVLTLPSKFRRAFAKDEALQALVDRGQIQFAA